MKGWGAGTRALLNAWANWDLGTEPVERGEAENLFQSGI